MAGQIALHFNPSWEYVLPGIDIYHWFKYKFARWQNFFLTRGNSQVKDSCIFHGGETVLWVGP